MHIPTRTRVRKRIQTDKPHTLASARLSCAHVRGCSFRQVFFGDRVPTCYRCVVNAGETVLIPSGKTRMTQPRPRLLI